MKYVVTEFWNCTPEHDCPATTWRFTYKTQDKAVKAVTSYIRTVGLERAAWGEWDGCPILRHADGYLLIQTIRDKEL